MYKLRDWVDETKLTNDLSCNDRAVEYLEKHELLIDNDYIFENGNAIHIIEQRIQHDIHGNVNYNANAVNFLRNNRQYIDYSILCRHEHGIELVDELIKNKELDKINWWQLSKNPAAMHILNGPEYYEYIDWCGILYNKNAMELVKNNFHMVEHYWDIICGQPHLIDIIEQNMDKIVWDSLSKNYNAIHILEKNLEKINIDNFCHNKNGFDLLLKLNYIFDEGIYRYEYHKNIVLEYFDYCEKNNIQFNLIKHLSTYGYKKKHMDFLKNNCNYWWLSMNPNIFEYDYKRMQKTRQSMLWYNDIKK
jgi:hypothetical protein